LRLLALLCGPLVGFATGAALSMAMAITLRLMPHTDASIWEPVSYVMAWIPVTMLVMGLAAIFGAYDLLVIVSCVVPALLYFAANYAMNVSIYLPDDGGTIYDIGGGIPPFDFKDHLWFLTRVLMWALATALVAIALKRWLLHARAATMPSALSPDEKRRLALSFPVDLGFVFLVTFAVLFIDLTHQLRLGRPDVIVAHVTSVLDSPASSVAERERALYDLKRFSHKFQSNTLARRATTTRAGEP
jgi:hypothetical protein